jgi:CDP-diacylglycerol--serine O-phosphatidyltransferase
MSAHGPDGWRDRRIEDPSNRWIIHPAARSLLPLFIARGVSANAVSVAGLCLGALAALAFANWHLWPFTCVGLLLSMAWLIADGLDGMIARATGTASALGRFLDGICDHGVFLLIYVALAASIGTLHAWILGACAGVLHAVQSNFYESERARFHRRKAGIAKAPTLPGANALVGLYDRASGMVERIALPFDDALARDSNPMQLGAAYADQAVQPLRLMSLLTANIRVYAIFVACLARNPMLFWWFEVLPLTAVLVLGLFCHRVVERRLIRTAASGTATFRDNAPTYSKDVTN